MANKVSLTEAQVEVSVIDEKVDVNICESPVDVSISTTGPQGPRGNNITSGSGEPEPNSGVIGDLYINTDNGYLYGPKTESGWGPGTPLGNNDPNDLGQVYEQATAASVWNINHTLAFIPNILVVDSAGTEVEGDYQYTSSSTITATFAHPFAGKAYLS